jgi:hypothetical protein
MLFSSNIWIEKRNEIKLGEKCLDENKPGDQIFKQKKVN